MYKLALIYCTGTLVLFTLSLAFPVKESSSGLNVSSNSSNRTRRQIITTDVANCGGNHSNTIGRRRRQIILTDALNCGGDHSNTIRRRKRAVQTDPNNIRFVVGNTQLFPLSTPAFSGSSGRNAAPPTTFSNQPSAQGLGSIGGDSGNIGGAHQNNIAIGGIQNFGGRYNDLITKLTGDTNNRGGTHSNNVAIGGILNFP